MKNLQIIASDGFDNPSILVNQIVPPSIASSSLGSLALALLEASEELLVVVVDISSRRLVARPAAGVGGGVAAILGATGHGAAAYATKDDPTKRASTWTWNGMVPFTIGDGDGDPLQNVTKPVQPALTSAQLIGAIEDATLDEANPLNGQGLVCVLDQGTGRFNVVAFDAPADAEASYGALGATIGFEQVPASVTSGTSREPLA